MSTAPPELNRIRSVRVPRRMYVSKFQRYGGAAIVVVLAVAVGAGILPKADRQERLEEKRRLERETWCDVGDARLDRGLPGPGAPPIKFDRCTTVDLTMRSEPLGNEGARLLSQALVGKRYGKGHRRNVRRLLLQHQDISDGGARSIARILAECADGHLTCAFDLRRRLSIDLTNNPITHRGVEQMRAGVERARSRGFAVVVWVGGRVEGETRRRGPLLKLGALELQLGKPPPRKTPASEAEIRIPPTLFQRLLPPDALTTVRTRGALVGLGFLCGYLASRLKSPVRVRVNLDWNEEATSVRAVRRFTKLLGGGIEA